ncbi:MAG: outer membrane beta-barrel protein [Ignavibacteriales bacterium]|nr:MAG: outer membrane beta-barrel protein [Ignavibacteriales bacterium]
MKYFLSFVLFFVVINFSFAQDTSKTNCNHFKHGIQFQVRSLLEFTNFSGYTFSYRYRINEKSGLRIGILIAVENSEYEPTLQLDSIIFNPSENYDNNNFKISLQYLHNILSYKDFSIIVGAGPFISFSKYEWNGGYVGTNYINTYFDKEDRTGYGLDLLLGVEYNPFDNIVVSGEYGLSISKDKADLERLEKNIYRDGSPERIYKESGERDRLLIRGLGVNLGVAIFF